MYSQNDFKCIKSQVKKIILLVLGVFAIFLAVAIIVANNVNNTLGMIIMVVGVCIDVFIWGMYVTPILAYYHYIKDIITGRSRIIRGFLKKVGTEPVYKDNKLFYYEVLIEEDGIDRILLLDNQKEWPRILTERTYEFEIHDSYVMNIREIAA